MTRARLLAGAGLGLLLAAAGAAPAARAQDAAKARLEALLRDAEAKASSRRLAEAVAALDAALEEATDPKDLLRVSARREEVVLARDGLDALARAIREHPERFTGADLGTGGALSLVDADLEAVSAQVPGGRVKVPWSTVDAARLPGLVERARLGAKDLLGAARAVHESGAREPAEKVLLAALRAGADPAEVFHLVARWRDEAVPEGGYVEQGGRFVAPDEKERAVLLRRVADAAARVGGKDDAARRAAVEELFSLGSPARPALLKALRARRLVAGKDLEGLKTLANPKLRARLAQEIEARRAAALALIEDPKGYPYPSADHKGQPEVNRLVGLVREAWERPFDLLVSWDRSIADALAPVAEAEAWLKRADPDHEPDLAGAKAAASRAVDVAGLLPDEWSWKVLSYNEKVPTTATREERECVLAVNEYRMMMGRPAVKIDERLMRAARAHSIEMRTRGYFAHESPTPGLESPGKRAGKQGYGGGVGENIAQGPSTGREAFAGWFHSSGHHRNMIGRGWTDLGCGRSQGFWTQVFGGASGRSLDPPKDPLPPPGPDCAPEAEGPREGK